MPTWPKQSECAKFYGRPGTNHVLMKLPYPMRIAWNKKQIVQSFTINKKCAASAQKVLQQVFDFYGMERIKEHGFDLFGGCYNNRPMRGGSQLSMHAYACAIDFDPERNQLKWSKRQAHLADPRCDRFWEFWEAEGWVSLGRARDFDWMHVQAANL